jgi:hypothetical protein
MVDATGHLAAAASLQRTWAAHHGVPGRVGRRGLLCRDCIGPLNSEKVKPWIGFASRETNAGPELSILFEGGTCRKYEAAADTVLLSYLPDQPLGAHESLSVDLADSNRVLLRFDWSQPSRVMKAELILSRSQSRHPCPSEPMTLAFHTVTEGWNESTTTWKRQPAFTRKPALTTEINPSDKEYRIDVTGLVRQEEEKQAPRHGWLIRIATLLPVDELTVEGRCPLGWSCLGNEYSYALHSSVHGGAYSCRIESRDVQVSGFAMMSQKIRADNYRCKRIRLSEPLDQPLAITCCTRPAQTHTTPAEHFRLPRTA